MALSLNFAKNTAEPEQARERFVELQAVLMKRSVRLDQVRADALLSILGNSNFLARWARSHPEAAAQAVGEDLSRAWSEPDFRGELRQMLGQPTALDREALAETLLHFKYRHLFRISLRDLGLQRPFSEIVAEFSALARVILQHALDWHIRRFQDEYGIPILGNDAKLNIPFTAIAMGKLGGNELNFSSDVDLIYIYGSDEGRVQGAELGPHEYFCKLGEKLSGFLQRKTSEGFLYRVDLDLRPEGKAGTLANSLDAIEQYYESFGADWEKQALIRASLGAGDAELCAEFLRRIHPFVFPKLSDFSFLDRLKTMKEKILQSIRNRHLHTFHLKLGEGGIREVEFFVQALQLLFGGRRPRLQVANTLEVLPFLKQAGLIHDSEEEMLTRAYVFLRTMEHRLQLVEEQQTHQLPTSSEELAQLARRMGYRESNPHQATDTMLNELEAHRHFVKRTFDALLSNRFQEDRR
jgi:glutamate-ammonia-ligase adenylyltransferase